MLTTDDKLKTGSETTVKLLGMTIENKLLFEPHLNKKFVTNYMPLLEPLIIIFLRKNLEQ